VNRVVAHEQLMEEALELCAQVERLPAHVLKMMKPLLRNAADMTWEQAIAMEEFAEPMCFTTAVHRERVDELLAG
jgi:2-(1,2-epoxy-1,2-dihydrophenyl)acetyl-CoA isomerase